MLAAPGDPAGFQFRQNAEFEMLTRTPAATFECRQVDNVFGLVLAFGFHPEAQEVIVWHDLHVATVAGFSMMQVAR